MHPVNTDEQPSSASTPEARYEAFVAMLVEHEPKTRAYLRSLLPGWHDVDEVMQQSSLVAWRKFDTFHQGTSFAGWFMTIARYEALKHRRNAARSPLVFSDDVWELVADEEDAASPGPDSMRAALEVCLAKLAPAQRELVLKTHSPGARINEIAQRAGKSEQALYKTVQRLRAALLECINRTMTREEPA